MPQSKPLTDAQQTEKLDKLRAHLQSIAIQAVQAQDQLGTPDAVADLLTDIESDLTVAQSLTNALQMNRE